MPPTRYNTQVLFPLFLFKEYIRLGCLCQHCTLSTCFSSMFSSTVCSRWSLLLDIIFKWFFFLFKIIISALSVSILHVISLLLFLSVCELRLISNTWFNIFFFLYFSLKWISVNCLCLNWHNIKLLLFPPPLYCVCVLVDPSSSSI